MTHTTTNDPSPSHSAPRRWLQRWWARAVAVVLLLALGVELWYRLPSASRLDTSPEVARVFRDAEAWEVFRIDPSTTESTDSLDTLHWHPILGRATVSDTATRKTLTRAFNRARRPPYLWSIFCWSPRHALRATLDSGEVIDLLICFECLKYRAMDGAGECVDQGRFHGSRVRSGQETFERVLGDLGLR